MIWIGLSVLAILVVIVPAAILVALVVAGGVRVCRVLVALVGLPMLVIGVAAVVMASWFAIRQADEPENFPGRIVASRAHVASPQSALDLERRDWPSGVVAEGSSQTDFSAGANEQASPTTTDAQPDGTRPLAVGASDDRPSWVGAPPQRNGTIHSVSICCGPFSTLEECEQSLSQEVAGAVTKYNDWYLQQWGGSHRKLFRAPRFDWDPSDPTKRYDEINQFQVGTMHNLNLRLDFDQVYRDRLHQSWSETLVARRLTRVAMVFGGILALLAMLHAYLRLDRATEQCYTRRLRCAAAGAILTLVGSGALLAHWIPWM
jgi:hypothetical protein